jgi:Family of unknown function (DUF6455)
MGSLRKLLQRARGAFMRGPPDEVSPGERQLLQRRMTAGGLDPNTIERVEPALARLMQQNCDACEAPQRCEQDLAHHATAAAWPEYCPNASWLEALKAPGWFSLWLDRKERQQQQGRSGGAG